MSLLRRLIRLEAAVHRILEALGDIHPEACEDRKALADSPAESQKDGD